MEKRGIIASFIVIAALSCVPLSLGTGLPNGVPDDLACLPAPSGGEIRTILRGATASPYGFKIYLPKGSEDAASPFPLLIYLHGSGSNEDPEVGPSSIEGLWCGPLNMVADGSAKPRYPLIIAAPQYTMADGTWLPERLKPFIAYLKASYDVNPKRVYLTGFSMGGYGTFRYIGSEPGDDIAAAVPVSGGGWGGEAALMARVPVWAFHGALDGTVSPANAISLVGSINAAHPRVRAKITIFSELGHDGLWQIYAGPGLAKVDPERAPFAMNIFDWMFQYSRP